MSLRPFSCPLPETRFFHAGPLVYKFKIRYGNLSSADDLDNAANAARELEEAVRVILGNLDNLHPFSTDHFTIFPYLSKWERVSKMRFKHGDLHLTPYPYICTMYLEVNSFQQNVSVGKEAQRGSSKLVKERNERTKSTETVGTVKRRRVEDEAEPSWAEADRDRVTLKKLRGHLWNVTLKGMQKPVRLKVKCSHRSKGTKSETGEMRS